MLFSFLISDISAAVPLDSLNEGAHSHGNQTPSQKEGNQKGRS
jgi:hypothetical protein